MSLDPAVALQVFKRDGWKCRFCGSRNGLHPHHLIYKSKRGTDNLNNLLTLCADCHRDHHDGRLLINILTTTPTDAIVFFKRKR